MGTRKSNRLLLALMCLAVASCSSHQDNYRYAVLDENAIRQTEFRFDIDSAVSYSTYFSCRYDLGQVDSDFLKLYIKAKSPSGVTFRDTVAFPLYRSTAQAAADPYTKLIIEQKWNANAEWTWRLNVSSADFGTWVITATPASYKGLHALGFSYNPSGSKR